ncbi:MAG: hypothetical protein ABW007_15090 [Chitinophagaceae bacterium]
MGAGDRAGRVKAVSPRQAAIAREAKRDVGRAASYAAGYSTAKPATSTRRATTPVSTNKSGQYAKSTTPAAVAPGPVQDIAPAVSTNPADYESRVATEPTYAAQETGWQKALADFQANQKLQSDQYKADYDTQVTQLGKRRETDLASLLEDYAARGLGQSGVYNEAQEKLRNQFATEEAGLATGLGQFGEQQTRDLGSYSSAQEAERAAARQAAIQRMILAAGGGG